jgi:hypothetical protein
VSIFRHNVSIAETPQEGKAGGEEAERDRRGKDKHVFLTLERFPILFDRSIFLWR